MMMRPQNEIKLTDLSLIKKEVPTCILTSTQRPVRHWPDCGREGVRAMARLPSRDARRCLVVDVGGGFSDHDTDVKQAHSG
jgi:hypothetical protein